MALTVHNRLTDPNLERVGLRYTLAAAIDEVIVNWVNGEESFGGYISREDYEVIYDVINEAHSYLDYILQNVVPVNAFSDVEIVPVGWINNNIVVRKQPH